MVGYRLIFVFLFGYKRTCNSLSVGKECIATHMSSESNRHNDSETRTNSFNGQKLTIISLLTVLAAVLITLIWGETANLFGFRRLFGSSARLAAEPLSASASTVTATAKGQSDMKTPIYFLSHGGVSYLYSGSKCLLC